MSVIAQRNRLFGMGEIEQSLSERLSAIKALQTLIDYARAEAADQKMPMLAYLLNMAQDELMRNVLKGHEQQVVVLSNKQNDVLGRH